MICVCFTSKCIFLPCTKYCQHLYLLIKDVLLVQIQHLLGIFLLTDAVCFFVVFQNDFTSK